MADDIEAAGPGHDAAQWRPVISVEEAGAARGWLAVDVGGVAVVLRRVDGAWLAVADACTHAGCAFSDDADLNGTTIICNCHGSEFDLRTGAVLRGPAEYDVRPFEVREREGKLEVRT